MGVCMFKGLGCENERIPSHTHATKDDEVNASKHNTAQKKEDEGTL